MPTSLGILFQCPTTLWVKNFFPENQPKPTLTQLHAVSLRPGHESEEIITCTFASPPEDAEDHNEVSPESPLLQAEQNKLPQLFFIWLSLKALHHTHGPSLDTLQ